MTKEELLKILSEVRGAFLPNGGPKANDAQDRILEAFDTQKELAEEAQAHFDAFEKQYKTDLSAARERAEKAEAIASKADSDLRDRIDVLTAALEQAKHTIVNAASIIEDFDDLDEEDEVSVTEILAAIDAALNPASQADAPSSGEVKPELRKFHHNPDCQPNVCSDTNPMGRCEIFNEGWWAGYNAPHPEPGAQKCTECSCKIDPINQLESGCGNCRDYERE